MHGSSRIAGLAMSAPLEILIYEKPSADRAPQLVATLPFKGRTELGRQKTIDETLYSSTWQGGEQCHRVVVARGTEQTIGRTHLLITALPDGRVELTNTSSRSTVQIDNGPSLLRGTPYQSAVPEGGIVLKLGASRVVRIQTRTGDYEGLGELPQATLPPEEFSSRIGHSFSGRLPLPADPGIDSEALVSWLQMALTLLQSATSSPDFFPRAAQSVVDLANMDSGRVLLATPAGWQEKARASAEGTLSPADSTWQPSYRILEKVRSDRKTLWQLPQLATMGSVLGVQAVVAAPILDQKGDVIGVLYGDRRQVGRPITRVEAMLVELLACGVASRLARLKEEQATLRFEQFFTPQLARHLAARPDLLDGRIAEVTILFCDVRGFSRFSHKLPPAVTVQWIADVMAALSDCVIEHQGVLVDYIGDEIMAMWGAPDEQPDHAQLACNAAVAMLDRLPSLNRRWQETLGEPMSLGIGLNSGEAHVGNTGSPRKFKYGPLGNTVNLASRVQGACKHLKTRLLITDHTFTHLDGAFRARSRRLCQVKVVNIDTPVTLYELAPPDQTSCAEWKDKYEASLVLFEKGNFRLSARTLQPLMMEELNDGPAIVLMSRAIQGLANGKPADHPIWELPAK
jgi:adenylate cyclase